MFHGKAEDRRKGACGIIIFEKKISEGERNIQGIKLSWQPSTGCRHRTANEGSYRMTFIN